MSRQKRVLVCAALLLAGFGVASAQEAPKWTYIEAGYNNFDPDTLSSDNGWFAGGSLRVFKNFHFLAEYNDVGDYTLWNAGFGWHGLLGDPGDLFVNAVWNDVEVDTPTGNVDDNGYEVSAGVRWKIVKWLEVKGAVNWIDLDTGGNDTTFLAEGLVTFMGDHVGIGASFETGDDDTTRVFARFSFGK